MKPKQIPDLTDREIQEGIYRFTKSTAKSASIIKTWVQVICWLSVIAAVVTVFSQLD